MPRLNFEVSESRLGELKAFLQETNSPTMKDLFNDAMTTLEWLVAEVKKGQEIVSLDEKRNSYRVLVTPILERAAKTARQNAATIAATPNTELVETKSAAKLGVGVSN